PPSTPNPSPYSQQPPISQNMVPNPLVPASSLTRESANLLSSLSVFVWKQSLNPNIATSTSSSSTWTSSKPYPSPATSSFSPSSTPPSSSPASTSLVSLPTSSLGPSSPSASAPASFPH
ncbi:Hypothetical predicted protein, partial [Prunus dulcis]